MAKGRKIVPRNVLAAEEKAESSRMEREAGEENPFAAQNRRNIDRVESREARTNRNLLEDVLHVHPNDDVSIQLVAEPLTGNNYFTWSRSIRRALGARDKLDLIDGNMIEPATDSYYYNAWLLADYMVSTWIMNSMSKELASAFQYIDNSKRLWDEIKVRFDRSNGPRGPRLYQLEGELRRCVQGSQTVIKYFNSMNLIWDEINALYPEPSCMCVCGASVAAEKVLERRRLMQLLLGLNDSFETVRNQILLLEPLPSVSRAFSMILQNEDQRKASQSGYMTDSAMFISNQTGNSGAKVNRTGGMSFKPRLSKEERRKLKCGYCGANGHEAKECFKLHGYPDRYKKHKEQKSRDQAFSITNQIAGIDDNSSSAIMGKIIEEKIEKCFLKYKNTEDSRNLVASSADPLSVFDGHYALGVYTTSNMPN